MNITNLLDHVESLMTYSDIPRPRIQAIIHALTLVPCNSITQELTLCQIGYSHFLTLEQEHFTRINQHFDTVIFINNDKYLRTLNPLLPTLPLPTSFTQALACAALRYTESEIAWQTDLRHNLPLAKKICSLE